MPQPARFLVLAQERLYKSMSKYLGAWTWFMEHNRYYGHTTEANRVLVAEWAAVTQSAQDTVDSQLRPELASASNPY